MSETIIRKVNSNIEAYQALQNIQGIPKLVSQIDYERTIYFIKICGDSLHELSKTNSISMKLENIFSITQQLITTIEQIHKQGFALNGLDISHLCINDTESSKMVYITDLTKSRKIDELVPPESDSEEFQESDEDDRCKNIILRKDLEDIGNIMVS